ncbi:MAG: hypothetical protein F6K22_04060 [Okeania sp. SIO2F4]|uniref:hypothetical protein n=1 Tax=Okeania sp. SIO2F4 TaxID=2607790 RepID=UPI001429E44E|nr:hypothetical protein [Okeania sp. SIO2F4]NES02078.1 hypothetical protein [Okeania sp. SIO2F4]
MMKFPNILTNINISIFKIAPILIGTVLVSSPSLAASFASSESKVTIDNFSKNPYEVVEVESTAESFSINGGETNASALAEANFVSVPANAYNLSKSVVEGTGNSFFALAESASAVLGIFSILPGETFSFDFEVEFDLKTSIDSLNESANAGGDVSFFILGSIGEDTPILLDSFTVSGNLETAGDNDFFDFPQNIDGNNFTIIDDVDFSFGSLEEYVSASFDGSYQITFDSNQIINILLLEVKANYAQVSAPEPSTTIAFLLFGALGVCTRFKSRINRTLLR